MKNQPELFKTVLKNLQINTLNEMQLATITASKEDKDIVLVSPTGTGKTLAYLLPVISCLQPGPYVQTIVLVPTRELALQIESVFKSMKTAFKVCCCYGGHPLNEEKKKLLQAPHIIIATPGRLMDHIDQGTIDTSKVKTLVLDEFDKSLEFGFQEQMAFIIERLPALEKRILLSATDMQQIPDFAGIYKPIKLHFTSPATGENLLDVKLVRCDGKDKLNTLYQLICNLPQGSMLVFCNQRETVENISDFLSSKGLVNKPFHGGLEQVDREKIMARFRNGSYNVLITTDLASRGLDIPEIQHIIHYDLAHKEDAFIHRNGRTARMHAKGTAFLLLREQDRQPDYIDAPLEIFPLKEMPAPSKPAWETLFIGKGKKDKINKVDIVGFLSQKGQLEKADIGFIEVKDLFSFVAVNSAKINAVVKRVSSEKIKGIKAKIEIAR